MLKIMLREWKLLVHERFMILFVLLFAASAYALLIGNLYRGQTVQNIPVAVCDLDDSPLSRKLTQMTAEADQYAFAGTLPDEQTALSLLEQGKLAAVLVIPQDFSKKFYCGETIDIAFLQDGSNTLQAGYALPPMQTVCAEFGSAFAQYAAQSYGTPTISPMPLMLSLRMHGNPTQSYLAFYMYGVMLMASQIGMIMGFSMSVYEDKRQGYFWQQGIRLVLLAKIIMYLCLSFLSVLLGILWLTWLFDLPLRGELGQTLLLCASFLFAIEGLAGLAAIYFNTRLALVQAMVFYALPAFLLSGYIWPEIGMVGIVRWLSMLQPVHYALTDFRALALTGTAIDYWQHVATLLSIGVIAFCLLYGFLCFGKEQPLTQGAFSHFIGRGKGKA